MTLLEVILAIAILGGSLAMLGELVRVAHARARSPRHVDGATVGRFAGRGNHGGITLPESTQGRGGRFRRIRLVVRRCKSNKSISRDCWPWRSPCGRTGCIAATGLLHTGPVDDRSTGGIRTGNGGGGGGGQQLQQFQEPRTDSSSSGSVSGTATAVGDGHGRNAMSRLDELASGWRGARAPAGPAWSTLQASCAARHDAARTHAGV